MKNNADTGRLYQELEQRRADKYPGISTDFVYAIECCKDIPPCAPQTVQRWIISGFECMQGYTGSSWQDWQVEFKKTIHPLICNSKRDQVEAAIADFVQFLNADYEVLQEKMSELLSTLRSAFVMGPALFYASDDFRSVRINGQTYGLTPMQAQLVEHLYVLWRQGTPNVGIAEIQEYLQTKTKIKDLFKDNEEAYKSLIAHDSAVGGPGARGTIRLNRPPSN